MRCCLFGMGGWVGEFSMRTHPPTHPPTHLLQVATQLLCELNPDVQGDYKALPPLSHLSSSSSLSPYSLIIATQLDESSLLPLAKAAAEAGKPLLVARSYGLLGYLR